MTFTRSYTGTHTVTIRVAWYGTHFWTLTVLVTVSTVGTQRVRVTGTATLLSPDKAADAKRRLGSAAAEERPALARTALQRPYLLIYRTLADPRYLDPTLDPSERPLGSIFSFGRDPVVGNYGEGLARAMTARGWLSTWSGLASHAALDSTTVR